MIVKQLNKILTSQWKCKCAENCALYLGGISWGNTVTESLLMCIYVCVSVVDVDGGPAEGASGRSLFWFGGFSSGADQTVSAAADGHAGGHTQCH